MKPTIKVSARLTECTVIQIKKELETFGCKTLTQFVQISINEKLERFNIGNMIEASIKTHEKLLAQLAQLLVIAVHNNDVNNKYLEELAVALTKISEGFDAFSNQNME